MIRRRDPDRVKDQGRNEYGQGNHCNVESDHGCNSVNELRFDKIGKLQALSWTIEPLKLVHFLPAYCVIYCKVGIHIF